MTTTPIDKRYRIPPDTITHPGIFSVTDDAPELWGLIRLKIHEAHARGFKGVGVTISINDTGLAPHPFLPAPIAAKSFTGDPVLDKNGHGSHCAGTALGRFGANGKALGVAPDAKLLVAKVLSNSGSGDTRGINAGRIWAAEQGADIISESLGDDGGPPIAADVQAYETAYSLGVSVCVAALGNAGYNGANTVGRPGSYKETIGVAAIREDGSIANFSSGGPSADVATPGEKIISCNLQGGWVAMSGTSMATPFFAGIAALVIQWHKAMGLKPPKGWAEWRAYLAAFVVDAGAPGHDPRFGQGVPDIIKLLDSLRLENI